MPTYEYECLSCHQHVEAVQKFSDPSLSVCPHCQGELRKVYSAVGIVFKGSGFYKNDSRGAKTTANPSGASSSDTATPTSTSEPAKASPPAPASAPSTTSESSPSSTKSSKSSTTAD